MAFEFQELGENLLIRKYENLFTTFLGEWDE